MTDALVAFKAAQKESWKLFTPMEIFTTIPAAKLVKFSRLSSGNTVLDVGCGTGVVAVTAALIGAKVSAIDLSPVLLEQAQTNIHIAKAQVDLKEGDVEALPYPDQAFDVVLSQFGHMFAPKPELAMQEMLRVLKPGGTIAFSTWPPDLYVGRFFSLVAKFSPPPEGISPSTLWGDPNFIKKQLGNAVDNIIFEQDTMLLPAMSVGHYLHKVEKTVGPAVKLVQESKNNPEKLEQFRKELTELFSEYFSDNHIRQHYLMTRARKKL